MGGNDLASEIVDGVWFAGSVRLVLEDCVLKKEVVLREWVTLPTCRSSSPYSILVFSAVVKVIAAGVDPFLTVSAEV